MNAREYFNNLSKLSDRLNYGSIELVSKVIKNCKGTIYVIGDGGSASTASHFAVDFLKGLGKKVFSLCDNSSILTAISNDDNFIHCYSGQLDTLWEEDDLLLVISVSGNSLNLVDGVGLVKLRSGKVIGLLGKRGTGIIANYCDIVISVDSDSYELCEDLHLAICHCIKEILANE